MALRKLAFNVASLTFARALQTIASLVAIPVLARLLEPGEFGLVALAMPFVLFVMAIADAGLGQSLVRVDPKQTRVWSSAFWFILMIGAGLSLFVLALAWPMAWLFEQPLLGPLIAVLAIIPLIQGALAPANAELQRSERFQLLAAVEVVSALGALFAALALAFAGAGAWALIAQTVLYWVIKAIIVAGSTKFRPTAEFEWSALEGHVAFGRDMALNNLVGFFQRQIDPLVIGKLLGAAPLGLYSMANRIAILPFQLFTSPAQSVLYTKMVAMGDDRAAIRDLMNIAALLVAIVVFPAMAVAAVASHAFFVTFLSAKWEGGAIIFSVIAPVAAMQAISSIWTPMLLATHSTALRLRLNVELAVLWLVILPFAAMHSILAVAIAYALSYFSYSLLRSFRLYLSPVSMKVSDFFGGLAKPIAISVAAALIHLALVRWLTPAPIVEVGIALILIGAGVLATLAWCWPTLRMHMNLLRSLLRDRSAGGEAIAAD